MQKQKKPEIVIRDPRELIFHFENLHPSDAKIEYLRRSIRDFGFRGVVRISPDDWIICGDAQTRAAILEEWDGIPCVVDDDLSEERIRAFRIIENRSVELAPLDPVITMKEIQTLRELQELADIDWDDYGFPLLEEIDVNDEDFLLDEAMPEKEAKKVICPNCGTEFAP